MKKSLKLHHLVSFRDPWPCFVSTSSPRPSLLTGSMPFSLPPRMADWRGRFEAGNRYFPFQKTCLQTTMAKKTKKNPPLFQSLKLRNQKPTTDPTTICTEKTTPVGFSNASHQGPRQLQVLWHTLLLPFGSAPKVASNRVTPSGFPGTKLPGFEVKPTIEKYSFF